jgi:uncharacterized protein (DUF1499 family)
MLKFPGRRPQNLGAVNGRFSAPPTWKPNWVSSQVPTADPHYTAPLATGGGAQELLARLKDAIEGMDGAAIIAARPDYLHAEFTSKGLGFVDDLECCCDGTVLHVRSSSRLGIRDFGVNRKRVEALRAVLRG